MSECECKWCVCVCDLPDHSSEIMCAAAAERATSLDPVAATRPHSHHRGGMNNHLSRRPL